MKNLFSETNRPIKTFMNAQVITGWVTPLLYMGILFTTFLFTACKKYEANKPKDNSTEQVTNNNGKLGLNYLANTMVLIHKHCWNFSKLKQQQPNIKT